MKIHWSDLWRWDGTVDRGPYALFGIIGFALKHNLDRVVASVFFHRHWELFNYWIPPTQAVHITQLPRQDAELLATMLALALPFIWVGVVLTLRRLRAVGLPTWLVAAFFAPLVNLLFFAMLSLLPSGSEGGLPRTGRDDCLGAFLDRAIPEGQIGSAVLAVLVTVVFGALFTALGTEVLARYGWGLFIALPFCLGLASVLLYGYHGPRTYGTCVAVAMLATVLLGGLLVALAIEGVVCLIMAMPLGLLLAWIGATIGYFIQARPGSWREAPGTLLVVALFTPLLIRAESAAPPAPPRFAVTTDVVVQAPPEIVWQRLVSFSELPPPREPLFRVGIAYPTRATLVGRGPGAVRRCEFSTGAFIEPIEVWNEPRRLSFSVAAQPAPLQEWTPYAAIHPPHLAGFLVSERGEFLLTPLGDGRTILQGTTWYQHHMWPAGYWQLWSDYIIHRIHLRVLRSIRQRAEQDALARR